MVATLVLLLLPLTLSTLLPLDPRDEQCDGMEGLECPHGCCPVPSWYCCPNWDYCAPTPADCEPCPAECDSCCYSSTDGVTCANCRGGDCIGH